MRVRVQRVDLGRNVGRRVGDRYRGRRVKRGLVRQVVGDRDWGSTDKREKDVTAPAMFAALPELSVIVTPEGRLTAVIASVETTLLVDATV